MVTVDVWRARIGTHCALSFGSIHSCVRPASGCLLSVSAFHFLICFILLIIGNVELNPGPETPETPETFLCPLCRKEFSSLGTHCQHQKIHSNIFNYSFECGECFLQFSSFQSLNSHISRVHKEKRKVTSSKEAQTFSCSYCQEVLQSFAALVQHLLSAHVEVDHRVTCPLQVDCDRTEPFLTKNAFRGHLSKQHPGWRGNDSQDGSSGDLAFVPPVDVPNIILDDFAFCSDDDADNNDDSDDQYFDAEEFFVFSEKDVFNFIARFYLMLEVECLISVASIGKICESLAVISEMVQARMRETLFGELHSLNLETGQINQILSKVSCSDPFYLAHHKRTIGPDMTSSHLRQKQFKEAFPQVPVLFPNFVPRDSIDGDRYAYVPLKDTLSRLLSDPSVQEEVKASFERFAVAQNSNNTILSDYTDGEVCKKRNLPPKRIDLIVFQDAFSVTSMLTSVQNKHKTLGVYFTLGNLPAWMRSRLRAMHLIMLILEKHCKKYRQSCWEKLKEELKELEQEGIDFMGEKIPVFLQFFVGDNLGSHFLGGFVEGFRASYFCRFCEVSLAQFGKDIVAMKALRSQLRYNLCAMRATKKKHCFGVKENSVFNELKNFKVCDPGLPPCLGHDLLHGVAEWDLKSILEALVKKNWFTFELLNRRIAIFKYSQSDIKNKPAPISLSKGKTKTKTRLGGSAVQNWKLLQLLPFVVQDLIIDPQDPHWQLFLTLKEMVEYICAPKIRRTQVDLLDSLIIKYLQDRKILPNKHKPKHHFLRHYATLIIQFGPLIHLWAMRFEQKHQFFKRVAKTCNNFINILKTLSKKCQLLFAYESGGARFSNAIQGAQPYNIDNSSFPSDVVAAISSQNWNSVKATKSVCLNGIVYKKGDLLILSKMNADLKVGWIEAILLDGVTLSFVLRNEIAELNHQMGIYHIRSSGGALTVAKQNALPYPCIQPVYSFNDLDSFSLRHSIV